jgi:type I restriction enzyme R subunit
MTPEELARQTIDLQLEASGWQVQDYRQMNIAAATGIAVREFPLGLEAADYMLYVEGKAIGVVEAKPEGHTLTGVEIQSAKYRNGLSDDLPAWVKPLPFGYESTGTETRFTNGLEPDYRSRLVFNFHRPEELKRIVELKEQVRSRLRHMPEINPAGLWPVQFDTIKNLEQSLAKNKPRALIQMATGSGKTKTACAFVDRLLRFGGARRVLFLVDRNNLGRQTRKEFQTFESPYSNRLFTDEYVVQHMTKNAMEPAAKVVISTIQRVFSMLKGEEEYAEENDEASMWEAAHPLIREPVPVVYNPKLPIETFDVIVIDECHRSIYNLWRQVLEYFDAFLIGLTATPTPQTVGFFRGNIVQDYSHEKAVADGINVGFDVFRIETKISTEGATLKKEPGYLVPMRDRRTLQRRLKELEDDLTYTSNQLNLDVVSLDQLRLVIKTFKEKLFTEIFPGRIEVPKTLVFAKTDLHADDVVNIIREEFGKGNEFCVKITSKTTGRKPEDLLQELRNSYNPRIAVTVDMIATGTDVKALECLLFLRNINSATYFEQMKGRGVRVIPSDTLLAVTPDNGHKTRFVIVDAVGVCDKDKTISKPLDRQPSVPLDRLLQAVAKGIIDADVTSTLASRLTRLALRTSPDQEKQIHDVAGHSLHELNGRLLDAIDPDRNAERAREKFHLAADAEPSEAQLDTVEAEAQRVALKPFYDPKVREAIFAVRDALEQVIDEVSRDELLSAGYNAASVDKARAVMGELKTFCETHKLEIEALQLLYERPYRSGLKFRHVKELAQKLKRSPFYVDVAKPDSVQYLWKLQQTVEPKAVKGDAKSLVDLIALVRHALHPKEPVVAVADAVEANYQVWLTEQKKTGMDFSDEQLEWLTMIKNHIATSLTISQETFEDAPFSQKGGLGRVFSLFGDRLERILSELNERLAA